MSALTDVPAQMKRWARMLLRNDWIEQDPRRFRQLFPDGAKPRRVATGFRFTEGPVWICEEHCLLFSDIPSNRIYKLNERGSVSVCREPSGYSNGLARDSKRRLIVCEQGTRRVTRIELDGSISVLADDFRGKRLNSPNDAVVKRDGAVYFTDPPYGIKPEEQEQPVQGVYRISPNGSEIWLVADDFDRPNGLAFSPDERQLYVDDSSSRRHVRVFDVLDNGSLVGGRVFCDMSTGAPGVPDGMKVDLEGHLFCAGPGGIWVLDGNGFHLGTIVTPEPPANCCWGAEDGKSLYIAARTSVYEIRVRVPGIPTLSTLRTDNLRGVPE